MAETFPPPGSAVFPRTAYVSSTHDVTSACKIGYKGNQVFEQERRELDLRHRLSAVANGMEDREQRMCRTDVVVTIPRDQQRVAGVGVRKQVREVPLSVDAQEICAEGPDEERGAGLEWRQLYKHRRGRVRGAHSGSRRAGAEYQHADADMSAGAAAFDPRGAHAVCPLLEEQSSKVNASLSAAEGTNRDGGSPHRSSAKATSQIIFEPHDKLYVLIDGVPGDS